MFEKLITKVLNKVLGDFIENLDPSQLDLSLMSGDIHLTNLALRPNIFDTLPVPFTFVSGHLGSLRVLLPRPLWTLLSNPFKIELSDIMVVVKPKPIREWDAEFELNAYKE
jgi:vacuolar protein sorting-associated protein 13A/C